MFLGWGLESTLELPVHDWPTLAVPVVAVFGCRVCFVRLLGALMASLHLLFLEPKSIPRMLLCFFVRLVFALRQWFSDI